MLWPFGAGSSCEFNPYYFLIQWLNRKQLFPPIFDEKCAQKNTKRQVIQDFDFIRFVLLVGGLLIFLMGISWGGSYYPWKSAHVIATIIIGFFFSVAFVLYGALVPPKEPLVPMYLFKNITWVATMVAIVLGPILTMPLRSSGRQWYSHFIRTT
jgi:magnesium-transporting ATPase (P-type)